MQYELSALYQKIMEATFPITKIPEIEFQYALTLEKNRIIDAIKNKGAFDDVPYQLLCEFVRIHYSGLMDFEDKVENIDEPYRQILKLTIKELKFLFSIHYHKELMEQQIGFRQLQIKCDGNQFSQVISLLTKLKLIKQAPIITIPQEGIHLMVDPDASIIEAREIKKRGFLSSLLKKSSKRR